MLFHPYRPIELLQPLIHPHLHAEPLPDERHLMRPVLGREELLPLLLLGVAAEVDVLVRRGRLLVVVLVHVAGRARAVAVAAAAAVVAAVVLAVAVGRLVRVTPSGRHTHVHVVVAVVVVAVVVVAVVAVVVTRRVLKAKIKRVVIFPFNIL